MTKYPLIRPLDLLLFAALASTLLLTACGGKSGGEPPTKEIVEQVLKANWDKAPTTLHPKSVLTLNSVQMGKANRATVREVQVDGLPEGAMVTPAVVDFSVRDYYTSGTSVNRRVREASIYKDKLGEWAILTGSVKGQDVATEEPAVK